MFKFIFHFKKVKQTHRKIILDTRWLFSLFFYIFFVSYCFAELTANVDKTQIIYGDTIELSITTSNANKNESFEHSTLLNDFEIVNEQKSQQLLYRNGISSQSTNWFLQLLPKKTGKLTIPALTLNGETSKPIIITVLTSNSQALQTGEPAPKILIEAEVDQKNIYIQSQLLVTIRILHRIALIDAQLSELNIDNTLIEPINEQDKINRELQGHKYQGIEKHFAVFPQQSGSITIPVLTFRGTPAGTSNRSLFYSGPFGIINNKPLFALSKPIAVTVKPIPQNYPPNTPWLPATALQLTEQWQPNTFEWDLNNPVSRIITLKASGLLASMLPQWQIPTMDFYKSYADQGKNENEKTTLGIIGEKQNSIAYVPLIPGKFTLPEQQLYWWNTQTDQLEQAVLTQREISIQPANTHTTQQLPITKSIPTMTETINLPDTASQVADDQNRNPIYATSLWQKLLQFIPLWQGISLLLLCLWLATLYFLLRKKPRISQNVEQATKISQKNIPIQLTLKTTLQQLTEACNNKDLNQIKRSLIQWAQCFFANNSIRSLAKIQEISNHSELNHAINILEQQLYAASTTNAGVLQDCSQAILSSCKTLSKEIPATIKQKHKSTKKDFSLPSLYPSS